MLLSNMSKIEHVSLQLLRLRVPYTIKAAEGDAPSTIEASTEEIEALELLLEVFLKGDGKQYNPNATYDFLASVFANVSTVSAADQLSRRRADIVPL